MPLPLTWVPLEALEAPGDRVPRPSEDGSHQPAPPTSDPEAIPCLAPLPGPGAACRTTRPPVVLGSDRASPPLFRSDRGAALGHRDLGEPNHRGQKPRRARRAEDRSGPVRRFTIVFGFAVPRQSGATVKHCNYVPQRFRRTHVDVVTVTDS